MRVPQVVIAEDDLTLHKLLVKAFKSNDCHVTGISDGAEVLQYLKMGLPDVLILDWGLPNADGRQIMEHIRRWDPQRKMRIVLMTGNQEVAHSDEAQDADLFMLKPVSIRDLVMVVHSFTQ